jgi:hypothetical protein
MSEYEEYASEDSWPDYNKIIDEILEYIEDIQKNTDEESFIAVKRKYPYFFNNLNNVENLENIKIRGEKNNNQIISDSIEYNLVNYLETSKEDYDLLLSLHEFLSLLQMPKGGKKSRKRKTAKKSKKSRKRKTAKKSKKSRKRKTAKKRKKSKK